MELVLNTKTLHRIHLGISSDFMYFVILSSCFSQRKVTILFSAKGNSLAMISGSS